MLTAKTVSGVTHATAAGEWTIYTATAIRAALSPLLQVDQPLTLDLSQVNEIDSAGLQLLLAAKRRCGPRLALVNHAACVLELFELTHLISVFGDPVILPSA